MNPRVLMIAGLSAGLVGVAGMGMLGADTGVVTAGGLGSSSRLAELFGLTMLPLWIASMIMATLIFERVNATRRRNLIDDAVIATALTALAAGNVDGARRACANSKSLLGTACARGLRDFGLGREAMKVSLMRAIQVSTQPVEESIRSVQTIASIAPLMGLLGTILGMVRVFGELANAATPDKSALADGIMVALFTTAAGLVIAIPGIICGRWLHARILSFGQEAENAVDALHEAYRGAGGIEPRRRKRTGRSYGI